MSKRSFFDSSAALAGMRIGGAGIGFLTQILLARMLGPHDLGLFYSVTSLATVMGYLTSLGYSQIAARFAGRYREAHKERLFAIFVSRAALDGVAVGCAVALAIVALSVLWPDLEAKTRICYALGGVMVIAATILALFTNLAGAIRMFGWCYVPEGIVRPAAFLVTAFLLWFATDAFSAVEVTMLFTVLNALCAVAVVATMLRALPRLRMPPPAARRLGQRWRREGTTLVLLSLYVNAFSDIGILFATPFLSGADVALFGVCLKLSLLIGYAVQVAQQLAIPDLADARRTGDIEGMRRAVRRSLPFPIVLTVLALIGCAVVGDRVLAIFGPHFGQGRAILVVMVACQLARALAGPSAHLVTLSGAQRLNATLCIMALVILLAADATLAPLYGPLGAAIAVFLSYTGWLAGTAVGLARLGEIRTDVLAAWAGARASRPGRAGLTLPGSAEAA